MAVKTLRININTKGFTDVHDLTDTVRDLLKKSGLKEGVAIIFVPGSTAGLTTIEYESGAVADLKAAINQMAPQEADYQHNLRWGDGNGFSHVRSAIMGPSLTVPFENGELLLGTWQQIVLLDFDNRPRHREIIAQYIGD